MTLWALGTQIPGVVAMANFRAPVVGAVLIGTVGYAVLNDRSLWSADFAQASPIPQLLPTGNIQPVSIARSGSSIALADTRSDGTTVVAFYATADFRDAPPTVTVAGLATTAIEYHRRGADVSRHFADRFSRQRDHVAAVEHRSGATARPLRHDAARTDRYEHARMEQANTESDR
jgi:hypothetical protein